MIAFWTQPEALEHQTPNESVTPSSPLAGIRRVVQTYLSRLGLWDVRQLEQSVLLMDTSCHWPLFNPPVFAVNAGHTCVCLLTHRYLIETM